MLSPHSSLFNNNNNNNNKNNNNSHSFKNAKTSELTTVQHQFTFIAHILMKQTHKNHSIKQICQFFSEHHCKYGHINISNFPNKKWSKICFFLFCAQNFNYNWIRGLIQSFTMVFLLVKVFKAKKATVRSFNWFYIKRDGFKFRF